jgi:membrane protease YdiL (CAAX protease family)
MNTIIKWMRKHSLLAYFILAYAFSWSVGIPLALKAKGIIRTQIPFSLHYLIAFGPMLSALVVTGLTGGVAGLKDIFHRMTRWHVKLRWWLFVATPLVLYLLTAFGIWLVQGKPIDIFNLGDVDFLPSLGLLALPLWIFTFGIGEETGWRGFALPRLQKGHSALSATILLWVMWAFWHVPLFFYAYPVSVIPGFLIGLLAGAVTFTWLFNSTKGSVLITALFHGAFNFTTACVSCKAGVEAAVVSTIVMIWAVLIVIIFKPANLSHISKQTIEDSQLQKNLS